MSPALLMVACLCAMNNTLHKQPESQLKTMFLQKTKAAVQYFGSDAPWFEANIPFFECSDRQIEDIYYYRWKLYKAHIRNLGEKGFLITEFLDDVGWQKQPYAMLNDATGFHIYEGRWLRDRRILDGFIDFLYSGGGNDRHFSESIADAAYALAKGDLRWATQYLGAMRHIYNLWDDHYDFSKGLYFIEPLLDATEYTISSIDASGGRDGFRGGDAFRPTINAYMYANALAISRLSALVGDIKTSTDYAARAARLKDRVQTALWNDGLKHFTDRYQVSNSHVKYWDFIRGRELAGYVPWVYNLPNNDPKYSSAWSHLLASDEFAGPFGLRTVGPSYEYYQRQYRYLDEHPECQWNGPSWPFQTTQVLLGMANLLNDYSQNVVSRTDYLKLLTQYAHQHYLKGRPNLQEDYNPDTGKPIVGLDRSHHYNHSGFTDLVITGLAGLRPRADDVLEVNPLIPPDGSFPYFCLENIPYHGRSVTIRWDWDGKRYRAGAGLSVYVDGRRRYGPKSLSRVLIPIGKPKLDRSSSPLDKAVNIYRQGFPSPTASSDPEKTIWQAIDGRAWFFPEMIRGWTPGSGVTDPWFALDFGHPVIIGEVRLSFVADDKTYFAPARYTIESWADNAWKKIAEVTNPIANTSNSVRFSPIKINKLRVRFHTTKELRLVELEAYE